MISLRGIKARPHDLAAMLAHRPSLVELHCSVGDLRWTPAQAFDVPLAVHVPEFDDGLLDPASLNGAERARAQAVYVQAVDRAASWGRAFRGKPKVVFHPGGHISAEEEGTAARRDDLTAALGQTVDAMLARAGADVEVLIENLPSSCWFYGGTWKSQIMTTGRELAAFCAEKGLGCTLDLCHLHLSLRDQGLNALDEISMARPYVRHIHYSDARDYDAAGLKVNQEGLQLGEGDLPLAAYFAALAPVDMVAVPEIWYGHEQGGAGFVTAWARAEALLAAPMEVAAHG